MRSRAALPTAMVCRRLDADLVGGRLELRHGNDGVEPRGAAPKFPQAVALIGRLCQAAARGQHHSQKQEQNRLITHTPRKLMREVSHASGKGLSRRDEP